MNSLAKIWVAFILVNPFLFGETVLVGTFFNGNNNSLHSRAYIWNPSESDASITARLYTLPRSGPSQLIGTVDLGFLNGRSGRNIKIAEDILSASGIALPYVDDGGNMLVEFTVGADDVRGTGQVFGPELAFGTYPLEVMSTSSIADPDSPGPTEGNFITETFEIKITEISSFDGSYTYGLKIRVRNPSGEHRIYRVKVHFKDADGFLVEEQFFDPGETTSGFSVCNIGRSGCSLYILAGETIEYLGNIKLSGANGNRVALDQTTLGYEWRRWE